METGTNHWFGVQGMLILGCLLSAGCTAHKPSALFAGLHHPELKRCIVEYVSENSCTNPNMLLLDVAEKGDTTCCRMVLVDNVGDFCEPPIQFFAGIEELPGCHIGIRHRSYPSVGMTIEGIVQALQKDFPWVRKSYRTYKKSRNNPEMPRNHGLFEFLSHYNECELKFVRGELVSYEMFACDGDLIPRTK